MLDPLQSSTENIALTTRLHGIHTASEYEWIDASREIGDTIHCGAGDCRLQHRDLARIGIRVRDRFIQVGGELSR
jgi:hypothetical protein